MSVFDDLAIIDRELRRLDPHTLNAVVREYRRGGLPASSMPEPVSGTRDYTPVRFDKFGRPVAADPYDNTLDHAWKTYTSSIAAAAKALLAARVAQTGVLEKADPVRDEVRPICANLSCGRDLESGRSGGECQRCRQWAHRHGMQYPRKPVEGAKEMVT